MLTLVFLVALVVAGFMARIVWRKALSSKFCGRSVIASDHGRFGSVRACQRRGQLELMSVRRGSTVTKAMFLNNLYGGIDEPGTKIIDVFICKLRKKLLKASTVKTTSKRYGGAAGCCTSQVKGRASRWWCSRHSSHPVCNSVG